MYLIRYYQPAATGSYRVSSATAGGWRSGFSPKVGNPPNNLFVAALIGQILTPETSEEHQVIDKYAPVSYLERPTEGPMATYSPFGILEETRFERLGIGEKHAVQIARVLSGIQMGLRFL